MKRTIIPLILSRKAGFDGGINNSAGMLGIRSRRSDHRLPGRLLRRKGGTAMKRSTDNRRSPAEVKADLQQHYGGLADKKPDGHAARQFIHKAYESYSVRDGEENE